MISETVRVGDRSTNAHAANYALMGHNIFRHQELFSDQHGIFTEDSGYAAKHMRWWLGYPTDQASIQYDKILDAYLNGRRKRSIAMVVRAKARHKTQPEFLFPLLKGRKWQALGWPYEGTHGVAFNKSQGTDNWESERAIDIKCALGTPVVAVANGTIGAQFGPLGSGDPRMAGIRLHLITKDDEFYYAHLTSTASHIGPGVKVERGEILGATGEANGVQHLHLAQRVGNPAKNFF